MNPPLPRRTMQLEAEIGASLSSALILNVTALRDTTRHRNDPGPGDFGIRSCRDFLRCGDEERLSAPFLLIVAESSKRRLASEGWLVMPP